MKFIIKITCFLGISLAACSAPKQFQYFRTGEVTCITHDSRLVKVSSIYAAGSAEQAQLFAERNAVENLLFRGIPGCYDVPIVADETASLKSHDSFYDWLIDDQEYERYMTEKTADVSAPSGGSTRVNMKITFDVPALRKEMENRGVIKKFGI